MFSSYFHHFTTHQASLPLYLPPPEGAAKQSGHAGQDYQGGQREAWAVNRKHEEYGPEPGLDRINQTKIVIVINVVDA